MFNFASTFNQELGDWNVSSVTDMSYMFSNATSFNQELGDWNVSSVINMRSMFYNATSFNQELVDWNVSLVTDMNYMFYLSNYNQNIAKWDISSVTNVHNIFSDSLSTQNYDAILNAWSQLTLQPNVYFSVGDTQYSVSSQASRDILIANGWIITDGGQRPLPFISTWKTTTENEDIIIPTNSSYTYNYNIDCDGDATFEQTSVTGAGTCTFASIGDHNISIEGTFPAIYINNGSSKNKILDVVQWGDIEWESMKSAFYGASNLEINALDAPNLTNVTDMANMFYDATSFNQELGDWNVSLVTDMRYMFSNATSFNQELGNWDVSSVSIMYSMFYGATVFNQELGDWNVSLVNNMADMFEDATSFNQDISRWDVSFVKEMQFMFYGATAFNQDIGAWDVSLVEYTNGMFEGATSFNQELGDWNVSSVQYMADMFKGVTLSIENYDSLLNSWSQLSLQNDVTFHGGNSIYSKDTIANRQNIIDTFGWTITDGGLDASIEDITVIEDSSDFNVTLNPTDGNSNTITYSATSSNTNIATVSIVDNVLHISLVENEFGVVSIEVNGTVNGVSVVQTFTVNISAVNDAPVIETTLGNITFNATTSFILSLKVNDSEGDTLEVIASTSNATIAKLTPQWTNSLQQADYDGVALSLKIDASVLSAEETATVTVNVKDGEFTTSKSFTIELITTDQEALNEAESRENAKKILPIILFLLTSDADD
jgi:surface protein